MHAVNGCIWWCASASTSWTGACEGPDSRLADPGLAKGYRLSWVRWSKGCKTPASSRLEGPAWLHPLPGGQQSPCAKQGRLGLPLKSRECSWTWGVAWRTESHSQVEINECASGTGWVVQATHSDTLQVAPKEQSMYPRWCSGGE